MYFREEAPISSVMYYRSVSQIHYFLTIKSIKGALPDIRLAGAYFGTKLRIE